MNNTIDIFGHVNIYKFCFWCMFITLHKLIINFNNIDIENISEKLSNRLKNPNIAHHYLASRGSHRLFPNFFSQIFAYIKPWLARLAYISRILQYLATRLDIWACLSRNIAEGNILPNPAPLGSLGL